MLIYLFIYAISCIFAEQASKQKFKWNIHALVAIILPTLLAGFRAETVGTDTYTYLIKSRNLIQSGQSIVEYFISETEIYYYILSYATYTIGNMYLLFSVYQFMTVLCIYNTAWFYRTKFSSWLVFWLYFCLLFPYSLNILRQIAAVAYLLNISIFLIKGRYIKYVFLSIFSIGFHVSAVIGAVIIFIIYYITNREKKTRRILSYLYLIGLIISFIFFLKLIPLLAILNISKFTSQTYISQSGSYLSVTDMTFRLALIILAFVAFFKRMIAIKDFYCYVLIIVTEMIFLMLGLYNEFLFRMALFMTAFHLIYLPMIACSKKLKKTSIPITKSFVFFIGLIYWLWVYVHNGTNEIIPYEFSI